MVDTPTPPTTPVTDTAAAGLSYEALAKKVKSLEDQLKLSKVAMDDMGESSGLASIMLHKLGFATSATEGMFANATAKIGEFMDELGRVGSLSKAQTVELSLLINAVDNVKESFGAAGFDFTGLNTFSSQVQTVMSVVGNSKDGLLGLADKLGIKIPAAALGSVEAIKKVIANTAASADNAIRLRDVYTTLSARTGELGNVHEKAGAGFTSMNALIDMQQKSINDAISATHLNKQAIESYYAQLGKVPGALNATVESLGDMTGGANLLTSTIQLARGAGMEYSDVVESMRKAIVGYGASVPEALAATARISEISKKYKIELADVKQELLSTADAFRMFGKDTSSASQIMNQYVGALQQSGLSGQASANIVGNMTRQISQLSIAQKAFLSAQSGGPGGLQGAFGVDMMLRQEGGQKKVMDMVMKTMRNQMGPLVSTAEAAQGGPAAAQFTKQIMMLQQGPLGALAKSMPEAEHLVDALKAMSEGKEPAELKSDQQIVQDTMKEGVQYQQQTATGVSEIVAMMQQARGVAQGGALSLLQSGFTAGTGEEFEDPDAVRNMRENLKDSMSDAARRNATQDLGLQAGPVKDRTGLAGYQFVEGMQKIYDRLEDFAAPMQGVKKLFQEGDVEGAAEKYKKEVIDSIDRKKQEAASAPSGIKETEIRKLDEQKALAQKTFGAMAATEGALGTPTPVIPKFDTKVDLTDLGVAGENVRNAAGHVASTRAAAATATAPHAHGAHPAMGTGGVGTIPDLTVKVEGVCIVCNNKMNNSSQLHKTNVGHKVPK